MSGDPLKGCEDILADGSPPRESSAQNITIPSIRVDQLSVNESSHGFIILKKYYDSYVILTSLRW